MTSIPNSFSSDTNIIFRDISGIYISVIVCSLVRDKVDIKGQTVRGGGYN